MFIGNLLDKRSGVAIETSYYRSNTTQSLPPTMPAGNLSKGEALGWQWDELCGSGLDIHIKLTAPSETNEKSRIWLCQLILHQAAAPASVADGATLYRNGADGNPGLIAQTKPQPGQQLTGDIVLDAGCFADDLLLRIPTDYRNLQFESIEIIGAVLEDTCVFPLPAETKIKPGKAIPTGTLTTIYTNLADADCAAAADYLQDLFKNALHISLAIQNAPSANNDDASSSDGSIAISKDASIPAEGYRLVTAADRISITASDRRGLLYGAAALYQLAITGQIQPTEISDAPFLGFRGVHVGIPSRENITFLKRLIRYLLIPLRYNTLFVEIGAGMRYDRHPEINEAWVRCKEKAEAGEWPMVGHLNMIAYGSFLEKDEVADIFRYAEDLGMEAIPEVHSLSHVQFLTNVRPDIAEIPAAREDLGDVDLLVDDGLNQEFFPSCYCPSNEESYKLLFDVLDEIIEVTQPKRYVHMGHDEVYQIGVCKVCREKDPAQLFADDVTRIHDYLASKGLKMMIWSDMLQKASSYQTPPAIDRIPKDIVMLDFIWYFHLDKDIETNILEYGFDTAVGNLYSSHFPRYEKRIRQEGMIGGQISTWVPVDEKNFALEGKMYDFVYTANMLWSETYRSEARSAYAQCIAALLKQTRPLIQKGHSLPAYQYTPVQLQQLIHAEPGKAPITIEIPKEHRISEGLLFVQAADRPGRRIPWQPLDVIGDYTIRYNDGTTITLPLEYGGSFTELQRPYAQPLKSPYFRHEGYIGTYTADPIVVDKAPDGSDFTLYGWHWENPQPKKKLASVTLTIRPDAACGLYLSGLSTYHK
ncbi:MAG: family 20 glycosylhydrolase [Firmicutes bacterium]|nr:family 20 glycosylhydrolase [Bacillota bacterium]